MQWYNMDSNNIITTINSVAEKIYSSVEGELYPLLDKIVIITPEILNQEPLKNMFFEDKNVALTLVASSFVTFFILYLAFSRIVSMYTGEESESLWKIILRIVICSILMSTSFYICKEILTINDLFTKVIESALNDVANTEVSFANLKEIITDLSEYMSKDFISIDGLIKGLISFGTVSLVINFSIRYATIIFLILISPIAFIMGASNLTIGIFKYWLKLLITNLLTQSVVLIIISIPLSFKSIDDIMFKIVLVGSIYILYKLNNITKEIIGMLGNSIKSARGGK